MKHPTKKKDVQMKLRRTTPRPLTQEAASIPSSSLRYSGVAGSSHKWEYTGPASHIPIYYTWNPVSGYVRQVWRNRQGVGRSQLINPIQYGYPNAGSRRRIRVYAKDLAMRAIALQRDLDTRRHGGPSMVVTPRSLMGRV